MMIKRAKLRDQAIKSDYIYSFSLEVITPTKLKFHLKVCSLQQAVDECWK